MSDTGERFTESHGPTEERRDYELRVAIKALRDIAGSKPPTSTGRLLRRRARHACDEIGVIYRGAKP